MSSAVERGWEEDLEASPRRKPVLVQRNAPNPPKDCLGSPKMPQPPPPSSKRGSLSQSCVPTGSLKARPHRLLRPPARVQVRYRSARKPLAGPRLIPPRRSVAANEQNTIQDLIHKGCQRQDEVKWGKSPLPSISNGASTSSNVRNPVEEYSTNGTSTGLSTPLPPISTEVPFDVARPSPRSEITMCSLEEGINKILRNAFQRWRR